MKLFNFKHTPKISQASKMNKNLDFSNVQLK